MALVYDDEQQSGGGRLVFDDEKPTGVLDTIRQFGARLIDTEIEGQADRRRRELAATMERSNAATRDMVSRQADTLNETEIAQRDAAAQAQALRTSSPGSVAADAVGGTVDFTRDATLSTAKGVVGLGESVVGLGDLATGWTGVTPGGLLKDFAGYDPKATRDWLDGFMSERGQADNKALERTKGFIDTLQELGGNPRLMAQQIVESLPGTVAAGAAGGVVASRYAGAFLKEAQALGLVGTQAQQFVAKALADNSARITTAVMAAAAGAEGAQSAGSIAETARQAGRKWSEYAAPAVAAGVGTAAIGFGVGRAALKAGVGDIETDIALRRAGMGTAKTGPGTAAERVVAEGLKEGLLEEAPQSAQESAFENIALGRPWDEGIGKATAQGLAAGAGMGAGHAAVTRRGDPISEKAGGDRVAESQAPAPSGPGDAGVATRRDAAGPGSAAPAQDAAGPAEAERALLEPRNLTSLDRVAEIDREDEQIRDRLAELNNPANGYGPMFDQERQELTARRLTGQQERDTLEKDWPAATEGAPTSFSTEAGVRLQANYALMDAGDLVTSHDESLRPNQSYPQELQPRQRERAASELQVSSIVQRLDPARLGLSADAANGAPIVGADGLVESGNARTIALKRVYQANGVKADTYRQFLRENAAQFGLTPEQVDGMQRPVLVRVRTTPVNRAEFARQANASTVAQMSPAEQGRADAARIDSMEDLEPDDSGDFSNAASRPFVRRFMARLPVTEQSGMLDAAGNLSAAGYARVRNAVLAKAYGDSPVLQRMTESMDDNLRNVSRALMLAAPKVAQLREAVAAGRRHDADITPDLMEAVEELSRLKDAGTSVSDALAQAGLLGEKYSPEVRTLLEFLADNLRRPRRMADFIIAYTAALDSLGDPNQGSLLDEPQPPTKGGLLDAAKQEISDASQETAQDPQRGNAGQDTALSRSTASQPPAASGGPGGDQGAGSAGAQVEVADEWRFFGPDSGTLGIPRAVMPQVKGKDRGALINFLKARGIDHESDTVPAKSLKPTQAEYSRVKVDRFKEQGLQGERSVLISSDGHVLDGHHQWLGLAELDETIPVIRLSSPIRELLDAVNEFPGVQRSAGGVTPRDQAKEDFRLAAAALADIIADRVGARAMLVPADLPKLHETLVRLFSAAIRVVGTDLKAATRWVKEKLKADPETKPIWNKVPDDAYRRAALEAIENQGSGDLLAGEQQPKVAMIDGRPYDRKRDNYVSPTASEVVDAELLVQANRLIDQFFKAKKPPQISEQDHVKAQDALVPFMRQAEQDKVEFDQAVIGAAQAHGIGQILAPVKGLARAIVKVVIDYQGDASKIADLLRATVIVNRYEDAAAVVSMLAKTLKPTKIKNKTGVKLVGLPDGLNVIEQARENFGGYADVSMVVRTSSGLLAEIQINVPAMMAVKDAEGRKLYEAARAQPKGGDDEKRIDAVMAQVYAAAFDAALRAADTMPENATSVEAWQRDAGSPGIDASETESSSNLNQRPSGNLTNSSPPGDDRNSQPTGNLSGTSITPLSTSIVPRKGESENGSSSESAIQIAKEVAKENASLTGPDLRAMAQRAIVDRLGSEALSGLDRGSLFVSDELDRAISDARYELDLEFASGMPAPVREDDIPLDVATQAYRGTSFSPERRAESARRDYVRAMASAWRQAQRAAGDDQQAIERVTQAMRNLVAGYRERVIAALQSHSRVASTMIAGPAKFPVASNLKKSEAADRRAQEANAFLKSGIARMLKAAKAPIDASPDAELERIRANLAERERAQSLMKAANAALRRGDDDALRSLGISDDAIAQLKKPDFAGRTGFPAYKLTNNNAEIARLRGRLEQAEKRIAAAAVGTIETEHAGARIVEDAADNRLRIMFDERPGEDVRSDLKSRGFRWSPNSGAWQRQLTDNARAAAQAILDAHYSGGQESKDLQPSSEEVEVDTYQVTRLSRGAGGGMDVNVLMAIAQRIKAAMPNMPTVHVLKGPGEAPKALREYIERQGAWNDVEGAMHKGELYLFASGLSDAFRAEHVLAEHEAAHFGLRAVLGSSLKGAMQLIYNNNASVRRAATALQARGKLTNAQATEEALVDIPTTDLARLRGWRRLVEAMRAGLQRMGFENLAAKIGTWLDGTLTEQQRADLMAANLVRAARAYVAGKGGVRRRVAAAGTMLSGTLADDVVRQERWLTAEAQARGYRDIDELAERDYPLFEKLAAKWREKNPADVLLSRQSDQTQTEAFKVWFGDSKVVDADGKPLVVYHGTAKKFNKFNPKRAIGGMHWFTNNRALIEKGEVGAQGRGVIVDAYLSIQNPAGWKEYDQLTLDQLIQRGYDGLALPDGDQTTYVAFEPAQIKSATRNRGTFDPQDPDIRMSRSAPLDATNQAQSEPTISAKDRAERIIRTPMATSKPIDAVVKFASKWSGVDFVAGQAFEKSSALLDLVLRKLPGDAGEAIKAGVISDYGVPEAVIDQRAMLQGRQRVQLRQAGNLIDKLATLTREESRAAYAWMNDDGSNPQAYVSMMQGLPEESVKVLQEVQQMIDRLSREAVRMGQLSPEAFEANRWAYLRRSYAKHTLEQTAGERAKRARVISILGDQYRGRGLTEAATMKQVQNTAPEWWKRKLQAGKADASLKGEKFVRLERRAPSGQGTTPLPGMTGRSAGRIREVAYWPAGETLPAMYRDWDQAGTFAVRDVKGDKLILWRDFTKDERERMGEIDEARFAIAKTLQGMIHDVEVGRYLEWLAHTQAKKEGETIPGQVVEASEGYGHVFKPGEWVKVPDTKIPGTSVQKYGKLSGRYLPGPVWNDLRQVVGGQFKPFGETYAKILTLWKTSKTALSPAVHLNNVVSNLVMADWHDVTAGHMAKALRILLGAHGRDGTGALGRVGNVAARAGGMADREAAREVMNRYLDSGGDIGSWATQEIARDQLEPLLESLERELAATNGGSGQAQIGVMAALQHALMLRFPSAWDAFKASKPGKVVGNEASKLIDLYQAEDDVFRLAAWLKAKEGGATDLQAGKLARRSFLDYHINAPWVQALRNSVLPFVSFTYRAVPMLLETAGTKPHKLLKLMMLVGLLDAMGSMLAGGGDDERKLLPEEKAGRIWGMVPKLIRMPWNDAHGSPVYLDIRRFVPVGDVVDVGQGHSAIPLLPAMTPGGPIVVMGEVLLNRSMFTGRPITQDTDTNTQASEKVVDHLWKAFAPNILGLPGTYATQGVVDSVKGRTDAFGRERSTAQAVVSSFGVKLGSYPPDVLRRNAQAQAAGQLIEIQRNISALKRQRATNRISVDEFQDGIRVEMEKKRQVQRELAEKVGG